MYTTTNWYRHVLSGLRCSPAFCSLLTQCRGGVTSSEGMLEEEIHISKNGHAARPASKQQAGEEHTHRASDIYSTLDVFTPLVLYTENFVFC